jgi:membrane protease subunit HflK
MSSPSNLDLPPPVQDRIGQLKQWLTYYVDLPGLRGKGLLLVAGLAMLAWVNAGIYKVQPDEQGVVLRFGRWVDTTDPGLHYHLPWPLETVLLPKVTQVNQLQLGTGRAAASGSDDSHQRQMLTGDENIVEAECAVFWRIKDAGQFLFRIRDPEAAVKTEAESALREVISRTPIQAAMSDKRQQIADQTRELLQTLLDRENSGILITQVQLQRVDPPAAVIDAFNDVQRARADQERARNEAEAYANDIIPRARGEAARITQEAEAYRSQVVNLAEGDAKGFSSVYQSYAKAKDVTSWRLYLDSMDEVLRKATRVIIDTSGKGVSGVVPYLPLGDKNLPAATTEATSPDKSPAAAKDAGK